MCPQLPFPVYNLGWSLGEWGKMAFVVLEREGEPATDESAASLAAAFFRACLYDLVLCEDDLDEVELRRWEAILRGGAVRDYSITRYYKAIVEAKRRSRNPANIAAYLIYRMSHGGHPERPGISEDGAEERLCIGCSAPVDEARRQEMVERIDHGLYLDQVRTPLDCEALVETHLTQAEVSRLVGHEVSFSYQERMIERIYRELEREEAGARP